MQKGRSADLIGQLFVQKPDLGEDLDLNRKQFDGGSDAVVWCKGGIARSEPGQARV